MRFGTPVRWAPADALRNQGQHLRSLKSDQYRSNNRVLEARSQVINKSMGKRALDVSIALGLIIFLLPAFIAIAAAIKATSAGPVLFRQQRYGAGKRVFWILKFRTMAVMEAHGAFVQAARHDARVTMVGSWLRRSSLDELPQLINVLMGTMSLVGPRPHALPMDDYFAQVLPDHSLRHLVRPGITGLAQVNGFRGPTDELEAMAGRVAYDVAYIRDWSLMTDLKILLRTPLALFGRNAF
jgi:putative colanic acid biosysnthesis UDP-glucose lipid carrier transferase